MNFDTMPMPVTSFIKEMTDNLQQQVDKIVNEEMPTIRKAMNNREGMWMTLLLESTRAKVLMDVIDSFKKVL